VKVKLIGARSFSCPSKGMMTPMTLNQVAEVDESFGKYLMSLSYRDALNNEHKLFSDNPDAEATYIPAAQEKALEDALKEAKEENAKARAKRAVPQEPAKPRTRSKTKPATADVAPATDAE